MGEELPDVGELLLRRSMIQQWLGRLDEQRGTVNPRILERVRLDYESRLQQTLAALAEHHDTLERDLESAIAQLARAEDLHLEAMDRFEEGRLRSLIGELDESAWAAERPGLEAEVEAAREAEVQTRGEADRLRDLLDQLREQEQEEQARAAPGDPREEVGQVPDEAAASRTDQDAGFITDADSTLSDPTYDPELRITHPTDEGTLEDTAPRPGLKCGECGYTNDLSAWFCGVCGADVG